MQVTAVYFLWGSGVTMMTVIRMSEVGIIQAWLQVARALTHWSTDQ